ncbi:hypothetical protein Acsp04_62940 [Actinomadura sp. NBRC 104425]|nr:hypothetical protein Acsp04_62940 [Actinomadura sp. NBRC 104425]
MDLEEGSHIPHDGRSETSASRDTLRFERLRDRSVAGGCIASRYIAPEPSLPCCPCRPHTDGALWFFHSWNKPITPVHDVDEAVRRIVPAAVKLYEQVAGDPDLAPRNRTF